MPKVSPAHVARRRQEILHAAFRCFSDKGFHQTTMREICQEAELSAGGVYGHFSSKEEIVEALAAMGRRNTRAFLESIDATGRAPQVLARILGTLLRFLDDSSAETSSRLDVRLWGEALSHETIRQAWLDGFANVREPLADILARGRERAELPEALDREGLARVLIALFLGLQLQKTLEPDVDLSPCIEVVTVLLEGGLSAKEGRDCA